LNRPYRSPIEIPELVKEYVRGKKFCEVGCGDGDLLRQFAKYAHKSFGVEMNPARFPQLDVLVEETNNIKIVKGDALTRGKAILNELSNCDVFFVWTQPKLDKEIFKAIPSGRTIISYKTKDNIGLLEGQYKKYPGKTEWIEFKSNEGSAEAGGVKYTDDTIFVIGILHKE